MVVGKKSVVANVKVVDGFRGHKCLGGLQVKFQQLEKAKARDLF